MENVVQTLHSSQKNLIKALKELELATNEYNRLVNKQVPYSEQELEKIEILRKKKGYICDMDGTLWVAKVTTKGKFPPQLPVTPQVNPTGQSLARQRLSNGRWMKENKFCV